VPIHDFTEIKITTDHTDITNEEQKIATNLLIRVIRVIRGCYKTPTAREISRITMLSEIKI
jgi:hypothetical protein